VIGALGLSARGLRAGRWWTLVSVVVVHGGWTHAMLNALGVLAFGAPVARRLGRGAMGVAWFLGFYLVCGALASLGYVLVHWNGAELLVGASGAISGLMGASSRLLDRDPSGRGSGFAPFFSRTVVGMALAWGVINALMAVGWVDVGAGAPVAWEAHLFGYGAGLLLIAPWSRIAGRPAAPLQPRRL
jgi:membrane associated rhomboid family serine protease